MRLCFRRRQFFLDAFRVSLGGALGVYLPWIPEMHSPMRLDAFGTRFGAFGELARDAFEPPRGVRLESFGRGCVWMRFSFRRRHFFILSRFLFLWSQDFLDAHIYIYIYIYIKHTHIHKHVYIYIYIYIKHTHITCRKKSCTHTQTCIHIHQAHTHTRMYIYIYIHI